MGFPGRKEFSIRFFSRLQGGYQRSKNKTGNRIRLFEYTFRILSFRKSRPDLLSDLCRTFGKVRNLRGRISVRIRREGDGYGNQKRFLLRFFLRCKRLSEFDLFGRTGKWNPNERFLHLRASGFDSQRLFQSDENLNVHPKNETNFYESLFSFFLSLDSVLPT